MFSKIIFERCIKEQQNGYIRINEKRNLVAEYFENKIKQPGNA